MTKSAALTAACALAKPGPGACSWCGRGRPVEVNHIAPCRGAHGVVSCAHHLDNLETLRRPCHRVHTAAIVRKS